MSTINIDIHFNNYVTNFKKNFENHYSKLEEYNKEIREHLKDNKKEILSCFFIVDSTPLGNYYKENSEIRPLVLFHVREFIELLNKAENLQELGMGWSGFFLL